MEGLSEEDKRALRGSKFAPLPSLPPPSRPRLAHPGGAIRTNKAAALAKFLERKLQEPQGLASIDPNLVELAVKNAKDCATASSISTSGKIIRHVDSFDDPQDHFDAGQTGTSTETNSNRKNKKMMKKDKKKKKNKKDDKKIKKRKFCQFGSLFHCRYQKMLYVL
ncbi:uncharacterized protein LOC115691392 isoform X2 [Syzygium oleosum]|uniref:uncharacterized protein LOC115691392 isoform X2 n=1 Tax=Syzygium oleosum TaxID=219896 RepID=UPI0024B949C9|nr:uncharacterized protein LOC115691392 isoform X2 [Syzygium oleosum]